MLSEIESMAEKMGLSIKSIVIDEDGLDIRLKAAGNAGKALPHPSRAQQVGDRIRIDSIDVDECEIDGERFNALHLKDVEAILVDVGDGKTFLFEDILFLHDIDAKESGKPFPETPLGKYLAGPFRKALENRLGADLREVSLLSYDNVFNDKSKDYMPFFENQTPAFALSAAMALAPTAVPVIVSVASPPLSALHSNARILKSRGFMPRKKQEIKHEEIYFGDGGIDFYVRYVGEAVCIPVNELFSPYGERQTSRCESQMRGTYSGGLQDCLRQH